MTSPERQTLEDRWAEFQALETLRTHWYWRPGWTARRQFYTWHITFEGQNELAALVAELQRSIDIPGLDLVPLAGLHLTTQGVGFVDEVSHQELGAIIDAVEDECRKLEPFDLTLGPVDPDAEGIGLLIEPWQPVVTLRAAIRAGIAKVWPTVPEPATGFRPHVTIAYTGANLPANGVARMLTPLRALTPATARISDVQLIALHRLERIYLWDTVHTVQIGGRDDVER